VSDHRFAPGKNGGVEHPFPIVQINAAVFDAWNATPLIAWNATPGERTFMSAGTCPVAHQMHFASTRGHPFSSFEGCSPRSLSLNQPNRDENFHAQVRRRSFHTAWTQSGQAADPGRVPELALGWLVLACFNP